MNYGHIREDGTIQTLEDHLRGTAKLAEQFTSSIGMDGVGTVVGLLHDLGKASSEFTDYIKGVSDYRRGEVDHSTAGAQFIHSRDVPLSNENLTLCVARQIMQLAIVSHHSGMIDCLSSDGIDVFGNRIGKSRGKTHIDEAVESIDQSILTEVDSSISLAESSLSQTVSFILTKAREERVKDGGVLRLGLLSRFVLSCLIDADRLDTSRFMDRIASSGHGPDWETLSSRLDRHLASIRGTGSVADIRSRVSDLCMEASGCEKGIFSLSVPTGGGKTLASLRFALNHALTHDMTRILYVAPYTTILEQNAAVVRSILEADGDEGMVLECHSNIDVQGCGEENYRWSGLSDNWDSPIIFTTMVQFLESLYASGTKRIRRMHNIANSIIIFDEIQALPIKTVHLFNESVNFLTETCGCSAVLCTATQPLLGKDLEYVINKSREIVSEVQSLSQSLRRTEFSVVGNNHVASSEDVCNQAVEIIRECDSLLVVANTKRMAREVYSKLKESLNGVNIYYLSTDLCPMHRKKILGEMLEILGSPKVICVSTQLIEAGVDVDFDSVIRCMAGLDSIVQAAGRCNRNGRLHHKGKVLVMKTDEDLGMLPEIQEGRRCTEQVIAEGYTDLLSIDAMNRYFELYFYRRRDHMSYDIGCCDRTLLDMLSRNISAAKLYLSQNGTQPNSVLRQSFAEANSMFHVIDVDSLIVPYDETAREAINKLSSGSSGHEMLMEIRKLQAYSVNTFSLSHMVESGMAYEVTPGSGMFCLADGYYDEEYGVVRDPTWKAQIF